MKYIVTALKIEAQAFVDKYKLGISKSNENITVVISGVGTSKMRKTTGKIVQNMNNNDTILNVGICGANRTFTIGELLPTDVPLTCVDMPIDKAAMYQAVDMESAGFLEATQDIKNSYMFKIVSDHFEPHTITKEKAKKLIYAKIDKIMEIVDEKSDSYRC